MFSKKEFVIVSNFRFISMTKFHAHELSMKKVWTLGPEEIVKTLISLTHCSREAHKRVIGKQCRPRSDAAERGI